MMVGDRGKKGKGDDENSEQIDRVLVPCSEKLQEIHDELEKEASDKVLETDQKHHETCKPVDAADAFLSHPMLGERLTEEDRKILEYLDTLDVEESKDVKSGYSITFNFRPNPFFEDSKLTKTFTFLEEGTIITATSIKWKEGMGLPNGAACEKKENKGPLFGESFFHWFSDAQHQDVTAQIHDEIADIIKEVWANPFTILGEVAGKRRVIADITKEVWANPSTNIKKDAGEVYGVNGFSSNIKCVNLFKKIADITKEVWANPFTNFKKDAREPRLCHSLNFVDPLDCRPVFPTTLYNLVSEEKTVAAYMYKMDRPWLRPDQVRVEIRRGRDLWVIGEGDKPLKVKLPSLNKMRVSKATASMNADRVLTIVIPKSHEPSKWHEYKDLVFAWFKTVHVAVST